MKILCVAAVLLIWSFIRHCGSMVIHKIMTSIFKEKVKGCDFEMTGLSWKQQQAVACQGLRWAKHRSSQRIIKSHLNSTEIQWSPYMGRLSITLWAIYLGCVRQRWCQGATLHNTLYGQSDISNSVYFQLKTCLWQHHIMGNLGAPTNKTACFWILDKTHSNLGRACRETSRCREQGRPQVLQPSSGTQNGPTEDSHPGSPYWLWGLWPLSALWWPLVSSHPLLLGPTIPGRRYWP